MLEFSNVFPSVLNWMIVGLMAVTFIIFAKWITAKMQIPYVSDTLAGV